MMSIDLTALVTTLRRMRADPNMSPPQTGDESLDKALTALAMRRLQSAKWPYWLSPTPKTEEQDAGDDHA